jgi:predicted enzyme related to lactoylglutathione lyase
MAVFPYDRNGGIGGCVVVMDTHQPSATGSIVYLYVGKDLDGALARTRSAGGQVAHDKTPLPGDLGHFAHIIDSEGNRVGLHASLPA